VLVVPGLTANFLGPALEVHGVASHVGHGVQGRGAAEDLASGLVEGPAIKTLLRHGVVVPVVLGVGQVEGESGWNLVLPAVPLTSIASPSFEQKNRGTLLLGQAVGQDATCRASADDDVVVLLDGTGGGCFAKGHVVDT